MHIWFYVCGKIKNKCGSPHKIFLALLYIAYCLFTCSSRLWMIVSLINFSEATLLWGPKFSIIRLKKSWRHFGKCSHSLSFQELNENIDTTLMSEQWNMKQLVGLAVQGVTAPGWEMVKPQGVTFTHLRNDNRWAIQMLVVGFYYFRIEPG